MSIQIIEGTCRDCEALRPDRHVAPGPWTHGQGWLGGTYGLTDDNTFVAMVRFQSKEAAARNPTLPQQSPWWAQAQQCFDGQGDLP